MSRSKASSSKSPDSTLAVDAARPRFLPWHAEPWQRLGALIAEDRLPHALLLEGVPGTGRLCFADAFALRLLCREPAEGRHCGECKACRLASNGVHADFLRVLPLEEGKAIGIGAVREAINFASRTASLGRHKVLLFSPAESMTSAAFNAFLKCLEEPAPDTVILLVFARGYPLPATIRSRCQRWQLPVPEKEVARSWLLAEFADLQESEHGARGLSVDDALLLSRNSPLSALSILDGNSTQYSSALVSALQRRGAKTPVMQAVESAAEGVSVAVLLELLTLHLQNWLRDQTSDGLRTEAAHAAFTALSRLAALRRAQQLGTNPNDDLLRFSALKACAGLWDC